MQSAAISSTISLSFNPRKLASPRFNSVSLCHSERRLDVRNVSLLSSKYHSRRFLSPIVCSVKQNGRAAEASTGDLEADSDDVGAAEESPVDLEADMDDVVVRAAEESSVAKSTVVDWAEEESSVAKPKGIMLFLLSCLWIHFNIYFNIYNKQAGFEVLKAFHYPFTVTLGQFATGSVIVTLMWTLNLCKRPKISRAQLAAIFPLAVMHTLGNLFTNMSLGKVDISFTHTIKAMEPFFSVPLCSIILGEAPTQFIISDLAVALLGIWISSLTGGPFNWAGFWSAMASNLTNQSRNVLSKKLMVNKEDSLDNMTLFSIITIMSFVLMIPLTLVVEGVTFTPLHLQASGVNVSQIYIRSLLAALTYHTYQQVAYVILESVSPVTHSVANYAKRVVVIVASVVFFRTPLSLINYLGIGYALTGVFVYITEM